MKDYRAQRLTQPYMRIYLSEDNIEREDLEEEVAGNGEDFLLLLVLLLDVAVGRVVEVQPAGPQRGSAVWERGDLSISQEAEAREASREVAWPHAELGTDRMVTWE